jgi:hypothetical protein
MASALTCLRPAVPSTHQMLLKGILHEVQNAKRLAKEKHFLSHLLPHAVGDGKRATVQHAPEHAE